MTWLSINPIFEKHIRIAAAEALSRQWEPDEEPAPYETQNYNPIYVAKLYNNAEQLGLDLTSIEEIED